MRVLYLYSEVMGYTMATIGRLVSKGFEVHVVYWDQNRKTPFQLRSHPSVYLYPKSKFSRKDIKNIADLINPNVVVVSGWMDSDYLCVARYLRRQKKVVVCGLDGQWYGTARQRIRVNLAKYGYLSQFFSHAWVSGPRAYEYSRRLGFEVEKIIFDLYSADLELFGSAYTLYRQQKANNYPHCFIFAGRLEREKGVDLLIEAWSLLGKQREDWELHLIGNGSMAPTAFNVPGVRFKAFMQPSELASKLQSAGCFVLPSRFEPWGVVVHEFAAGGLPLLLSDAVGASTTFLVNGLNGFSFKSKDPEQLKNRMRQVIKSNSSLLLKMGDFSHLLSKRITPETSASNLMSLVY